MNELLAFLNSHASVRTFTDQEITPEQERDIIVTAQRSPTSSNIHAYSVISIRDSKMKEELAYLTGGQQHVSDCSLFLVFCGDLYRLNRLNSERGYRFNGEFTESFLVAVVDATLVASRALLAAQAFGLGGVMVGGIRNHPEEVSNFLELPELVFPIMGMSLGVPQNEARIKPRLPVEAVCFREKYSDSDPTDSIAEYDQTIKALGYLNGREVEPDRYPDFRGDYSWSEHTARRMASEIKTTQRPHLLKYLQDRGLLKK
jgi:FMN reductase (NADPH)